MQRCLTLRIAILAILVCVVVGLCGGVGMIAIQNGASPPLDDPGFAEFFERVMLCGVLVLAAAAPAMLAVLKRRERRLERIAADVARIRKLDFSRPAEALADLDCAGLGFEVGLLRETLRQRDRAFAGVQAKLEHLIDLGISMGAERDTAHLMETILVGAKEIANAEGGTLYLRDADDVLRFEIIHNDRLGVRMGGLGAPPPSLPGVALFGPDGAPNRNNVVSLAVHRQRAVAIDDAYAAEGFDFSGTRAFDARNGYRSQSFLTVPLKPHGGEVIGAVQLINARGADGRGPIPFTPEIQRFVEALAGQAATALDNRLLLDAQDRIMDGMVRFVAGAIDAKSPYTGGHCARVPELAMMLAQAASAADTGPFADFAFTTVEEWQEFRIGAWLHDCGKVTTPEHVVDKATKLETIANRIHEVRTRFEVLLRDAEIARRDAVAAGVEAEIAQAAFDARAAQLHDDYAFVAACNVGTESMSDADIARLVRIAAITWERHFDDRLGLSEGEKARLEGIPVAPTPALEPLLADRPEHVVRRGRDDPVVDPSWGFNLKVPAQRFNFGELHNLSVRRGTLTDEERAIINQHIVQTIVMLESLPFPPHLRRVPEYAGTHHETLTGTGYPRGLTAADLSIPARIMAVADVFEALTAADRPYKKAKPLSEAVEILHCMAKEQAIDPEVFALFLSSGVCDRYAQRFLTPEQIDGVDVTRYLGAGVETPE